MEKPLAVPPPVDEVVGMLSKYSPHALEDLRRRHPGEVEFLRAGIDAGEASRLLRTLADVCSVGLQEAVKLCDQGVAVARVRLATVARLQVLSQVIAVLASASVLNALRTGTTALGYVWLGAGLAALSSIASIAIQVWGRSLQPGGKTLVDLFSSLLQVRPEAGQLKSYLDAWLQSGADDSVATEVDLKIKRGNELCGLVYQTVSSMPPFKGG